MIYCLRNRTGYRIEFACDIGVIYVDNGQQIKFDRLPKLNDVKLKSKEKFQLRVIDRIDTLGNLIIIDIGLDHY